MAGRPIKGPNDAEKFRQEYLKLLDLQAKLNETNLQKNLLHKRTGQIATQITDYRTASQKLADVLALRFSLKRDFRRIADNANSEQAVNDLNDGEVQYAAQTIEEIISKLRPRFKFGVPAPYLVHYIQQNARLDMETGGVPGAAQALLLEDIKRILSDMPTKDHLNKLRAAVDEEYRRERDEESRELYESVMRSLGQFAAIVEDFQLAQAKLDEVDLTPEQEAAYRSLVNGLAEELPNDVNIEEFTNDIQRHRGDPAYLAQELEKLNAILGSVPSSDKIQNQLWRIGLLSAPRRAEESSAESERREESEGEESASSSSEEGEGEELGPAEAGPAGAGETKAPERGRRKSRVGKRKQATALLPIDYDKVRKAGSREGYTLKQFNEILGPYYGPWKATGQDPSEFPNFSKASNLRPKLATLASSSDFVQKNRDFLEQLRARYEEIESVKTPSGRAEAVPEDYGLEGEAVVRQREQRAGDGGPGGGGDAPRRVLHRPNAPPSREPSGGEGLRRRIKGRGLGVKETMAFAPFGKYVIDTHKLADDIVKLRYKNGNNLTTIPTQRVSVELANCFRRLVAHQKVTFNDLAALTDEDKRTYNKFLRMCRISSEEVDMPEDVDKEDLHHFEVWKGEILSGNDSKELIKKFKVLVVKLMHNGRLPRGQAKSLLLDLAELGY